uniref:Uncharacterized protein n=1 Tax=Photinus pyralis TaxID=7054 RepID=A0A1Y1KE11_PHOPY
MSIIKNYHVVTFAEDESVEIVPDIWMHPNGQCYWPPKKVKKTQAPDKSSWHLYEIKILGTYSSYEKAREKLILAEVTSDLNTDGERDSKQYRKVSKKKHLSTSNEEGSESDRQSYPSPPKKKLIKEKRLRTQRCSEVTPAKKYLRLKHIVHKLNRYLFHMKKQVVHKLFHHHLIYIEKQVIHNRYHRFHMKIFKNEYSKKYSP